MQTDAQSINIKFDIPISVDFAIFIVAMVGFGLFLWCVLAVANRLDWLRKKLPSPHDNRLINSAFWFAAILSPVWLALIGLTIFGLFDLWLFPDPGGEDPELNRRLYYLALAGLTTVLAGLVGAPLAILRVHTVERQTKAQEEGLITDRINKAVKGLGSEKVVKRIIETPRFVEGERAGMYIGDDVEPVPALRPDGTPIVELTEVEETVPNLEVRIGSIYALERIAKQNLDVHIQIMEILCAYVRENAPSHKAKELPNPPKYVADLDHQVLKEQIDDWEQRYQAALDGDNEHDNANSSLGKVRPRADVQTALSVLGRRNQTQKWLEWGSWRPYYLCVPPFPEASANDLSSDIPAYLIEVDKWEKELASWKSEKPLFQLDLRETSLQGADLSELDFSHANFENSEMQGVILNDARIQCCNFSETKLQSAVIRGAEMQGAFAYGANLQGAFVLDAHMQGTNLFEAQMFSTYFNWSRMHSANLSWAECQHATLSNSKLENADFHGAQMQGCEIEYVELFPSSDFGNADTFGASIRGATVHHECAISLGISETFGDSSTVLIGLDRPAQWPDHELGDAEYNIELENWRDNPSEYRPPSS